MTYLECRDFLLQHPNTSTYMLVAVNETIDYCKQLELELTDEQFTTVCAFVYSTIVFDGFDADDICDVLLSALKYGKLQFEDLKKYTDNYDTVASIYVSERLKKD